MMSANEKMLNIAENIVSRIDPKNLPLYGETYVRMILMKSLIGVLCFSLQNSKGSVFFLAMQEGLLDHVVNPMINQEYSLFKDGHIKGLGPVPGLVRVHRDA